MAKKLNKSTRVREMLDEGKNIDAIVKKVGCSKTLVKQIYKKMRVESDKKVETAYAEKVGGNPIPDFLQHKSDPINPDHYKRNGIEIIDVIEAYCLNYRLGNVVKYVTRSSFKDDVLQDLKKARWYLDREISKYE